MLGQTALLTFWNSQQQHYLSESTAATLHSLSLAQQYSLCTCTAHCSPLRSLFFPAHSLSSYMECPSGLLAHCPGRLSIFSSTLLDNLHGTFCISLHGTVSPLLCSSCYTSALCDILSWVQWTGHCSATVAATQNPTLPVSRGGLPPCL